MTGPRLLFLLALLAAPAAAHAEAFPVDDTGTRVLGQVDMAWDSATPERGRPDTASGGVTVLLRLDMSPWRGRSGRLYLTLPARPQGRLLARWSTRGPLLPGQLRDGERALVLAGPVTSDVIEDTLRLTLHTDGEGDVGAERLDFAFEFEPDPT